MTEEVKKRIAALRTACKDQADCDACPINEWCNYGGRERLNNEVADLIESLSAQLEQVTQERDGLSIMLTSATSAAEKYKRERDAAVEDLREADRLDCEHCINYSQFGSDACDESNFMCTECKKIHCRCKTCRNNSNWQWRGVEGEG